MSFAAVMIIFVLRDWNADMRIEPVYFATIEACEAAAPGVRKQLEGASQYARLSVECHKIEDAPHAP